MLENEKVLRTEPEIVACVSRIWHAMKDCTRRGISTEGILGGGLSMRRAPELYQSLSERDTADPLTLLDWVRLFAVAVSEENAAAGRVVAAPTNGAAGVVAAVAQYYLAFTDGADDEGDSPLFPHGGGNRDSLQTKYHEFWSRDGLSG